MRLGRKGWLVGLACAAAGCASIPDAIAPVALPLVPRVSSFHCEFGPDASPDRSFATVVRGRNGSLALEFWDGRSSGAARTDSVAAVMVGDQVQVRYEVRMPPPGGPDFACIDYTHFEVAFASLPREPRSVRLDAIVADATRSVTITRHDAAWLDLRSPSAPTPTSERAVFWLRGGKVATPRGWHLEGPPAKVEYAPLLFVPTGAAVRDDVGDARLRVFQLPAPRTFEQLADAMRGGQVDDSFAAIDVPAGRGVQGIVASTPFAGEVASREPRLHYVAVAERTDVYGGGTLLVACVVEAKPPGSPLFAQAVREACESIGVETMD